ncbi:hypothetical protein C8F04DRAFT_1282789 [Mycena alexandri]|uniref:Uncharacterized protein n=1 Tax=Mycena alexandri TaxID=1745969 RepID=A0AAD6RZE1_9AGAR|nr:hypothetical protein C8F04DRAFT_1282789 [Mycena alexandri]
MSNIPGGYPVDPHSQLPHDYSMADTAAAAAARTTGTSAADEDMTDAAAAAAAARTTGTSTADEDIPMEDDTPPLPPAKDDDVPNPAKRRAIGGVRVEATHDSEQYARDKAKQAIRENKEMARKLKAMEDALAAQTQYFQRTQEWHKNQLAVMNMQWDKKVGEVEEKVAKHKEQMDRAYNEQLERHKADQLHLLKAQLDSANAARELKLQEELAKIAEERQREKDAADRAETRRQADWETNAAAFNAHVSTQRLGARRAETVETRFPDTAPPLRPQYVSAATRQERQVEAIIRDNNGRFPTVMLTAPTEPGPSGGTPTPEPGPSAETPQSAPVLVNVQDQAGNPLAINLDPAVMPKPQEGAKKPRKQQNRKPGVEAEYERARQTQQALLTTAQDRNWKEIIRIFWRKKYGFGCSKDWVAYKGEEEGKSLRCSAGLEHLNASSKLYFGSGWASSLWNKEILQLCVKEVLRKRKEDPNSYAVPDVTAMYLEALLYGNLKDAHTEWARHQPRGGETEEEAKRRADQYDADRRAKNVGNSRKQSKFAKREKVADLMMKVYTAKFDARAVEAWKWRKELMRVLGAAGMSSEEDNIADVMTSRREMASMMVHAIKVCPWRAPKVNEHMEAIDEAAPSVMKAASNGRMRTRTKEASESLPPLGLPRSVYNAAWLSAQKALMSNIEEEYETSETEFKIMEVNEVARNNSGAL